MLQPKKLKYRKRFRGKMRGMSTRGNSLSFGDYGLKSIDRGWVTQRQIEAARRAIAGHTKRKGRMWVRVFPDKPITKKPSEVRMGKGKGAVEGYVVVIKPGRVLFEVSGVEEKIATGALRLAAHKLPIKTRILTKD